VHKHECGAPGQGEAAAQIRRAAREAARAEAARAEAARAEAARAEATRAEAARAEVALAPAGLNAQQDRLVTRLFELQDAHDYQGVVALEHEALALARELRGADPGLAGKIHGVLGIGFEGVGQYARALELFEQEKAVLEEVGDRAGLAVLCSNLGQCYYRTGDYGRALALHEQRMAMEEALGDRLGVATACTNLGNCYFSMGDYGRALELLEQSKAICEELGHREGVARACSGLGNCYLSTGDFVRALALHEQYKTMAKELGHRDWLSIACGNLGICYKSTGDYARALELHEQCKAIYEELGDRVGVATACGNLGLCYECTGDYARALELHEQNRAICDELGDRAGVAAACSNIGNCMSSTGEYMKAISYSETEYVIAEELGLKEDRAKAALDMGVAMRLHVRADRQAASANPALSPAAGASHLPGPRSWAAGRLEDRVKLAALWLETALAAGCECAKLHLAHLAYDAGQEDIALDHLKFYLSWRLARGRDWCVGCGQKRGEDAPMLTCSGCRVARFCTAEHQKMASKKVVSGGSLREERHKDICGLLGKWRGVEKDRVSPGSLRADLLAFLRQRQ